MPFTAILEETPVSAPLHLSPPLILPDPHTKTLTGSSLRDTAASPGRDAPRCPWYRPLLRPVAKAGVGAAEMVLSQAPLLGVGPDGGGGGEGVSVRGCPSWGFELAHG